jgi:hypothetical protein
VVAVEEEHVNEFFTANVQFSEFFEVPAFHAVFGCLTGSGVLRLRLPMASVSLRRRRFDLGQSIFLLEDDISLDMGCARFIDFVTKNCVFIRKKPESSHVDGIVVVE